MAAAASLDTGVADGAALAVGAAALGAGVATLVGAGVALAVGVVLGPPQATRSRAAVIRSAPERAGRCRVMRRIVPWPWWRSDRGLDIAFLIACRLDHEYAFDTVRTGRTHGVLSSLPPTGGADWAGASGLSFSEVR